MRALLCLCLGLCLLPLTACRSTPPEPDPRYPLAESHMAALDEAIQLHYLETGRLPRALEELLRPTGGGPPYLEELRPDPWGRPYLYEVRSDGRPVYRLTSAGPDGALGTPDDLQLGAIR